MERCGWAIEQDPLYIAYHDREWGVPLREEGALFGLLCLEGAQAGLSWRTILHRREGYQAAFRDFDPVYCAALTELDIERLMADSGIVRNRRKIEAVRQNAQALLRCRENGEDFAALLWSFVGGEPEVHSYGSLAEVPASTAASDAMSRALKARGFAFVGSTICYAFMQASGMVMDHVTTCFRHGELLLG